METKLKKNDDDMLEDTNTQACVVKVTHKPHT